MRKPIDTIKQYIKKTIFQNRKGYLTVELTMIFPALFFSLLLILFMGMVLYQEVKLQSLAVQASERGSVIYSSRVSDMNTGVKTLEDFNNRDPYRYIPFFDSGMQKNYETLINGYVAERMGSGNILSGHTAVGRDYVDVEDYVIVRRVRVNIQNEYQTPVDTIAEMFGKQGTFTVNTTAVSTVVDAPEFVRNVDLAIDISKAVGIFDKAEEGYTKVRQTLDKVLGWLE